ncbi:MAG: hypothetical protein K2N80_03025 [Lachnospiraceae bacterium]|nr:hypothetical protein [Lachnospiraceae bacterium]
MRKDFLNKEQKIKEQKMKEQKVWGSKAWGKKTLCLGLSISMVLGLAGCGKAESEQAGVITEENQEDVLMEVLNAQVASSHSSEAGKEETVYVLADANGSINEVIVSDWLKNRDGSNSLADCSDLTDIRNVKGYETFDINESGDMVWQAEGADIYYRGSTEKEVPVEVKLSYWLDGKEITPEALAGKSGKVTIRMDYINRETKTIIIGGKEQEIKVPFAMISGVILPQDKFSNIEMSNARLLSEGNNSVVIGVAFPGLAESIQMEELKDKMNNREEGESLEDLEIPDYIEITADVVDFELGMTMTVAMSDVLSDIELTDSFDLSELNDSMEELKDATNELKDGTEELKDGSGKLKDGTVELVAGTDELLDGTTELKDGTQELYEKSGLLDDGAKQLDDGAAALYDGTVALQDGVTKLTDGTGALKNGSAQLADGTGSLVEGTKSLNDGALLVQGGIDQVASQMDVLKAGIGTPVTSSAGIDPANPATLLQVSWLLNQTLAQMSSSAGLSETYYNAILASLTAQKAEAQANLDTAQENLVAAQGQAAEAQVQLLEACQADTQDMEVVTDTYTETEYQTVQAEVPVYTTTKETIVTLAEIGGGSGQSDENDDGAEYDESGEDAAIEEIGRSTDESTEMTTELQDVEVLMEKEIIETDTIQIQSVDVENLQEKVNGYQAALEEAAVYQAQVEAYSLQVEALDAAQEALAAADADAMQQLALMQQWGPAITYAAVLEQKLEEISDSLNSQESVGGITALVQGAGALADGTQTALLGAEALNSGANELKNGIEELNSGAGELADGAGNLKDGAATLKNGTNELQSGTGQLVEGTNTLNDGAGTLKDGVVTLKDGVLTLDEGMGTLDEGALALVDGMFEFDEEGISKLTDLFGDDVQDVLDRLRAVSDAGKEYNTFTRLPENTDGSVKFIIKTEAVTASEE